MKQIVFIYMLLAALFCNVSCIRSNRLPIEGKVISPCTDPNAEIRNTRQEYEGTYTGSPPCFSGTVTTEVTLKDNRYLLKNIYILKSENKGFEQRGEFTCSKDGGRIHLHGEGAPNYYLVGKDVLIPLDDNGNPLDNYGKLFCLERVAVR